MEIKNVSKPWTETIKNIQNYNRKTYILIRIHIKYKQEILILKKKIMVKNNHKVGKIVENLRKVEDVSFVDSKKLIIKLISKSKFV